MLVKKFKTKISTANIADLMLYFMVFRDYINNRDRNVSIGCENHHLSNFFIHIGNLNENYYQPTEWFKFKSINELRHKLELYQYEDKAIIIDLKKKMLSAPTTIMNVHQQGLLNFNILFSENIKRFSTLKEKYFIDKVGTKREYGLALHLSTGKPVILLSQTVVNVFSTGSIYYLLKPGTYVKAYLKQIFSLPYSYYIDPSNFAALVVEIYTWDKRKRKIKRLKKEIINWKEYFHNFVNTLLC